MNIFSKDEKLRAKQRALDSDFSIDERSHAAEVVYSKEYANGRKLSIGSLLIKSITNIVNDEIIIDEKYYIFDSTNKNFIVSYEDCIRDYNTRLILCFFDLPKKLSKLEKLNKSQMEEQCLQFYKKILETYEYDTIKEILLEEKFNHLTLLVENEHLNMRSPLGSTFTETSINILEKNAFKEEGYFHTYDDLNCHQSRLVEVDSPLHQKLRDNFTINKAAILKAEKEIYLHKGGGENLELLQFANDFTNFMNGVNNFNETSIVLRHFDESHHLHFTVKTVSNNLFMDPQIFHKIPELIALSSCVIENYRFNLMESINDSCPTPTDIDSLDFMLMRCIDLRDAKNLDFWCSIPKAYISFYCFNFLRSRVYDKILYADGVTVKDLKKSLDKIFAQKGFNDLANFIVELHDEMFKNFMEQKADGVDFIELMGAFETLVNLMLTAPEKKQWLKDFATATPLSNDNNVIFDNLRICKTIIEDPEAVRKEFLLHPDVFYTWLPHDAKLFEENPEEWAVAFSRERESIWRELTGALTHQEFSFLINHLLSEEKVLTPSDFELIKSFKKQHQEAPIEWIVSLL